MTAIPEARMRAHGTMRAHPAGSALFQQRERVDAVFLILEGRVKLASCAAGREVLLAICGPGDLLGEAAAAGRAVHEHMAVAIDPVRALVVCVGELEAFLSEHPEEALPLVRALARRLAESERRRIEFTAHDTLRRLACLLLDFAERFGEQRRDGIRIDLPLSQEELAGCIGASHRAVATALGGLRRLRLVATGWRTVTVVDAQGLRELIR